jgi:SAM-dependent methyltransferase
MAEFDQHADRYADALDKCVAFTGGGSCEWSRYKAAYLRDLLGRDYAGKILDYGCGVGLLSQAMLDEMPRTRVDGFDVSTASTDKIAQELKAHASFTNDLTKVGKDYDLIVLANVLHHIQPPMRPGIFKDLASRLAPGGRIAVFEHNPYNPATRYIVATCEFDEDAVLLTRREALGLLRDAGLSGLTGEYIAFLPVFLAGLRPLETCLRWCPLGAQHATIGRRSEGQNGV